MNRFYYLTLILDFILLLSFYLFFSLSSPSSYLFLSLPISSISSLLSRFFSFPFYVPFLLYVPFSLSPSFSLSLISFRWILTIRLRFMRLWSSRLYPSPKLVTSHSYNILFLLHCIFIVFLLHFQNIS